MMKAEKPLVPISADLFKTLQAYEKHVEKQGGNGIEECDKMCRLVSGVCPDYRYETYSERIKKGRTMM